ncbi:hypothetical protein HMPREF9441_02116 [Paraprevotella clara YIT 11840]|uniref:Uncharacterized protein n=1 Tax=Paraprevotella clara YIT 11840 TaxID=762968 RepID=G5SRW7_9BACT|nr:hypothetical protein HMPREF9441_02116 [Paraprevotella clara YIT 11840]
MQKSWGGIGRQISCFRKGSSCVWKIMYRRVKCGCCRRRCFARDTNGAKKGLDVECQWR